MWLKPGQKYLFGRVKKDGVRFAIDHKTVSRKHCTIEVDHVKEGDVGHIHARTKVRVTDHSKSGTSVNGELVKSDTRELKNAENSIRPGTCPHEIIITWQPCVLTFNLLKKEIKSGVLKAKQTRVQYLDIKAISDFSAEHTTHVVANKRNTAKGLLALVTGKYLVAESYLDAIEYTATPTNLSQDENLSRLEMDFDSNWPRPKDHLPPPGKEPTVRPVESYEPDPSRTQVFQDYIFVFCDQTQYDNLLPAITSGHGKALLFKVVNGETTSDELIRFLENASGRKDSSGARNKSKGGVILVRWQGKDEVQEWTNTLINEAALKMDQRAIDQSEFLDAILAIDAGLLKQRIPFESTNDGRIAPPPSAAISLVAGQPREVVDNGHASLQRPESGRTLPSPRPLVQPEPVGDRPPSNTSAQPVSQVNSNGQSAPRPFQGPRFTQTTKFSNFDDGFDPDDIAEYHDDDAAEEDVNVSDFETQSKPPRMLPRIKDEPPSTTKKRPRSPTVEPDDAFVEEINDLLPAATALKRRKLAAALISGRLDDELESLDRRAPSVKKRRQEKELDVREAVRAQREEKEAAAKREEEDFDADMGDLEGKGPANLVDVVTIELPVRDKSKQSARTNGEHGPGWDPKWNGRKNFKGFRRKGEAAQRESGRKIIVPLVEVEKNTFGFGDQYWEKTEEEMQREREQKQKKKRRDEVRTPHTQSPTQRSSGTLGRKGRARIVSDEDQSDDNDDFDIVASTTRTSPDIARLQQEAAEIVHHEIDPDTPRRTRAADRSQVENSSVDPEEARQQPSQKATMTARGKRPATAAATPRESKRQKTLPVTVVHASDSENDSDDMKFRFGSRARRGRGGGRGRGKT